MRLIDAGRIEKRLLEEEPHDGWDEYYEGFNRMKGIALNAIDATPTIDAVPVVRGEWIEDGDMQICSNCGEEHSWEEYRASYCEDCGAKMEDKP